MNIRNKNGSLSQTWIWGLTFGIMGLLYLLDQAIGLPRVLKLVGDLRHNPFAMAGFLVAYVVSYSTLPLGFFPVAAGAVFGFWQGAIITNVAENLSALIPFLVVRRLTKKNAARAAAGKMDAEPVRKSKVTFGPILASRLVGLPHFVVVNYLAAVSDVKVSQYLLANFLGMFLWLTTVAYMSNKLWRTAVTQGAAAFRHNLLVALWPLVVLKAIIGLWLLVQALRHKKGYVLSDQEVAPAEISKEGVASSAPVKKTRQEASFH